MTHCPTFNLDCVVFVFIFKCLRVCVPLMEEPVFIVQESGRCVFSQPACCECEAGSAIWSQIPEHVGAPHAASLTRRRTATQAGAQPTTNGSAGSAAPRKFHPSAITSRWFHRSVLVGVAGFFPPSPPKATCPDFSRDDCSGRNWSRGATGAPLSGAGPQAPMG